MVEEPLIVLPMQTARIVVKKDADPEEPLLRAPNATLSDGAVLLLDLRDATLADGVNTLLVLETLESIVGTFSSVRVLLNEMCYALTDAEPNPFLQEAATDDQLLVVLDVRRTATSAEAKRTCYGQETAIARAPSGSEPAPAMAWWLWLVIGVAVCCCCAALLAALLWWRRRGEQADDDAFGTSTWDSARDEFETPSGASTTTPHSEYQLIRVQQPDDVSSVGYEHTDSAFFPSNQSAAVPAQNNSEYDKISSVLQVDMDAPVTAYET